MQWGQTLGDFPDMKLWFETNPPRSTVVKGYAVMEETCKTRRSMDDETRAMLFDQTGAALRAQACRKVAWDERQAMRAIGAAAKPEIPAALGRRTYGAGLSSDAPCPTRGAAVSPTRCGPPQRPGSPFPRNNAGPSLFTRRRAGASMNRNDRSDTATVSANAVTRNATGHCASGVRPISPVMIGRCSK